jgi:hypothetical protein
MLPLLITSTPIDPVPLSQEILTVLEDTAQPTAKNWELKPFPDANCSGDNTNIHNDISPLACTVLADAPSRSYCFSDTIRTLKVCVYNQKRLRKVEVLRTRLQQAAVFEIWAEGTCYGL